MLEWGILVAAAAVAAGQETLTVALGVARSMAVVSKVAKETPEVQERPQAVPETPEMQVHQALRRPRLVLLFPAEAGATVAAQVVQAPEAMVVVANRHLAAAHRVVFPPVLAEAMGVVPVGGVVQGDVREGQAVVAVARAL
jgi:hypothetical protein